MLTKANEASVAVGMEQPARNLQCKIGNEVPAGLANDNELAFGSGATFKTVFGHDFSRVPVFSKQRPAGHGLQADKSWLLAEQELNQVGVGRADVMPAAQPILPAEKATGALVPAAEVNPDEATACTLTSRTMSKAPDGTPDMRKEVGVCEWVVLNVSEGGADWVADSGYPISLQGSKFIWWQAPEQPGESKIAATIPDTGESCALTMNVVAPAKISMKKTEELTDYLPGTAGAGMRLNATFHPLNVSFHDVAWKEDPGPAVSISGEYFQEHFTMEQLSHAPRREFVRLREDNTWEDTAATNPKILLPKPWKEGSYCWHIPNRYSCHTSSGTGHHFADTLQCFSIDGTGKVTVTKEEASVERSP